MQTLSVEPEGKEFKNERVLMFQEVKIDPIDNKIKTKVLNWLT